MTVETEHAAVLEGERARPLRRLHLGARDARRPDRGRRARTRAARFPADRARRSAIPAGSSEASFELRALTSDLVIGAGTTARRSTGSTATLASADGTLTHVGEPLERGDEYSIVSYVPQPTPEQLRDAPVARLGAALRRLDPGRAADLGRAAGPARRSAMPLWGEPRPGGGRRALLASPYAETYRLAREWTAGAATPYDAVRAIEGHLRARLRLHPDGPRAAPTRCVSFLFDDEAGYCQQFAGSMALMLRMVGIPTRVVSGFAPGLARRGRPGPTRSTTSTPTPGSRSTSAGIGWVTFDPTPGAAPAESQRARRRRSPTAFRGPAPEPAAARVDRRLPPRRPGARARRRRWTEGDGAWRDRRPGAARADRGRRRSSWTAVAWRRRAGARRGASGSRSRSTSSRAALRRARLGAGAAARRCWRSSTARAATAARPVRGYAAAPARAPLRPGGRRRRRGRASAGPCAGRSPAAGSPAGLRALLAIPPGGPARA